MSETNEATRISKIREERQAALRAKPTDAIWLNFQMYAATDIDLLLAALDAATTERDAYRDEMQARLSSVETTTKLLKTTLAIVTVERDAIRTDNAALLEVFKPFAEDVFEAGMNRCAFCKGYMFVVLGTDHINHEPTCATVQARKLLAAEHPGAKHAAVVETARAYVSAGLSIHRAYDALAAAVRALEASP